MQYRFATVADSAVLAQMNQQLIRDEGHRNPMDLPQLEVRMADWLSGSYTAVLFEQNGTVCGYALFRQEAEHVYLRQFYMSPALRRKGHGRRAIEWLKANAWTNAPRVRLDVLVGNTAGRAFWQAMGFTEYCVTMELNPHAQA